MRSGILASLILAYATVPLMGQSGSPLPAQRQPAPPRTAKTLTLDGCVQLDDSKADWSKLSDKTTWSTYHLIGPNVRAFVWRSVRIVGGLVPSPNIAAQAGAIDPTKTAMAYARANTSGTGNVELLEFHVTRVRPLTGS